MSRELEERLAALELDNYALNEGMCALAQDNQELHREIEYLTENFRHRQSALWDELERVTVMFPKTVEHAPVFPATYKLIKAQLFHNPPATGYGYHPSEWRLKLGFWTHSDDEKMYKNGTITPLMFNMRAPDDIKITQTLTLYSEWKEHGGMDLLGCRELKGKAKSKGAANGTELKQDQVAAIFPSISTGRYPDRALVLGCATWAEQVVLDKPFIPDPATRKANAATEIWTRSFA